MTTPLVSVIVPVYNGLPFLAECLQSVLTQTYPHIELIAVDNGSTDGSLGSLRSYARTEGRMKIFSERHRTAGMARNTGLKHAQGAYVMFVDADDVLHPQCLEQALDAAQRYAAGLVVWPYLSFTQQAQFSKLPATRLAVSVTADPVTAGCARVHYVVWGKLYKKELLENIWFGQETVFEDIPFVYEVLARRPRTAILQYPLYAYRNNPHSLSNQPFGLAHIRSCQQAVKHVIDLFANKPQADQAMVRQDFIPRILKDQLYRCRHANPGERTDMFQALTEELQELNKQGWLTRRGHRLNRYVFYKYLLLKHRLKRQHP